MSGSGEYIDRKAALRDWPLCDEPGDAYQFIRNFPAADVRPVVLCRDCTHCRKGKASLECEKHTYAWNNMNRWVDENDFCSWGVKREEN